MRDKDFELENEAIINASPLNISGYKLNISKVKDIEDIKTILKHMELQFRPKDKEAFEEMKHLLIIN